VANYNVDLLVRASTDAALKGLDKVAKTVEQINARAREGIDFGNIRGFGKVRSAFKEVRNSAEQVAGVLAGVGGASVWGNLSNGIASFKTDLAGVGPILNATKAGIGGLVEQAVRGLPAIGDAVYAAGSNFDKFAQWFSALDPQTQIFAAGIAALTPQVFKLTRAFTKKKQSLIGVSKGFSLINEAGQKANGSLVNGMTSVQIAIEKAAAAQQQFDKSLRGASLTQLNQVTREAKNTLEGYWSMTGKAEKAANNYVKALRAQKQEQEAINKLVKEAKARQGLSKAEQKEAAVALAAQKELALAEKAQQKKKEDHERRMRKFDRERVKSAKAKSKIEEQAQRNQRLREGLMLGVGFPLLFGGGPGAILGGGAGAFAQSKMGDGKGFGAQIALSAVGGQIDRIAAQIITNVMETSKAVTSTANAYAFLEEKSLFSTNQIKERAAKLKEQGNVEKLNTLLSKEYIRLVGREGLTDLKKAGEEAEKLKEAWEELALAMSALMAGPLGTLLEFVNKTVETATGGSKINALMRDLIDQGDKPIAQKMHDEMMNMMYPTRLGKMFAPVSPMGIAMDIPADKQAAILKKYSPFRKTEEKDLTFGENGDLGKGKKSKLTETEKIEAERKRLEMVFQYGEREAAIRTKIKKIHADVNSEKALALRKDLETIDQLKDMNALYQGIGQTIKDGLVESINAAIDGTKTLGEVASDVFKRISNQLLNYGVDVALSNIPGIGSIFKRAAGGPVTGGTPYIVGEKGPELFVPGSSGKIVPNHAMGGTNVVVNVDASGSSVAGDAGQSDQLGSMLAAAVQAEIANQKRPGGLLA
jgi:hypothetical protein